MQGLQNTSAQQKGVLMHPADRNKAINKAKNLANTKLRQRYKHEWRKIYVQEATALGLTVSDYYIPSIRVTELEEEVERLKAELAKVGASNG
jgi:hypothetical protein